MKRTVSINSLFEEEEKGKRISPNMERRRKEERHLKEEIFISISMKEENISFSSLLLLYEKMKKENI